MPILTFIIPVRHQDNAADWSKLKANLSQTIASIAAQSDPDWKCIIVANEGADLPDLPPRFAVEHVGFPPNDLHNLNAGSREDFLNAFRIDKGRRVLSGMLRARDSSFFMIVDDDDFVSRALVAFVKGHADQGGWMIRRGYVWNDGGNILLAHDDFNHICGSSLIVRSDLYALPESFEQASREFMMTMLGSHYGVADLLNQQGRPLGELPFRGAVYRVANPGSHSQTPGLMSKYVFTKGNVRRPWRLAAALARLRLRIGKRKADFFGNG